MASRKSERLINLTMALLATRRYLSKSEIFRTIDGYSGNEESKERMFERDKDDLRNIGIAIEVRSQDPLFDDEPGYRIHPESYSLALGDLSGAEIAILSLAAQAWRGAALSESAQSALVKLRSLGIESDFDSLPALSPKVHIDSSNFLPLAQAVAERRIVAFTYLSSQMVGEERRIEPYGLGSRKGVWYLVGRDLTRDAIRTFRISRIIGEASVEKNRETFTVESAFDVLHYLDSNLFVEKYRARVKIRLGKGHTLRTGATIISSDGDFELLEIQYQNEAQFLDQILWHADDVIVESPIFLREQVMGKLNNLVTTHE